jgi:hypothetical protein
LRTISVATPPQSADFALAAIGHRNEPHRMIFGFFFLRDRIIASQSEKVAQIVANSQRAEMIAD